MPLPFLRSAKQYLGGNDTTPPEAFVSQIGVEVVFEQAGETLISELGVEIIFEQKTFAITAVDTSLEKFTVAGDYSAIFTSGVAFMVSGSTGNNDKWTVSSSVYGTSTVITVNEDVTDATVDGVITLM